NACIAAGGWSVVSGQITTLTANQSMSLSADPPIIPSGSLTDAGQVTTRSTVTITVTDSSGNPLSGISTSIQSSRPDLDSLTQPTSPTDSSGMTTALVETEDQTLGQQVATSTITSGDPDTSTSTPATITWLPAEYEDDFLITCYITSLETSFPSKPV